MTQTSFTSEQVPSAVRVAIQRALKERMNDRGLSTYGLANAMNSSQSTVFNAVEYGRFGGLFAGKALEFLGMDVPSVVRRYGDPAAAKALVVSGAGSAPSAIPASIKTLASKLKWSETTVAQVQVLYEAADGRLDSDMLKRAGNMYEAVNRDVLSDID